jgi:hypothetical protein
MGDRGNIVIDKKIWLYTHWTGSSLPQMLSVALERGRERWSDRSYLIRVIFCEMIRTDLLGITGFGIDYEEGDGGTDIYLDHEKEEISWKKEKYKFQEFIDKFKHGESNDEED